MRERFVSVRRVLPLLCAVLLAVPATAAPVDPVADVTLGVTQVQWTPKADFAGLRLTVSGPEGTEQLTFGPAESPVFDLAALSAGVDGLYTWELRATPQVGTELRKALAAARNNGSQGQDGFRPEGLPAPEMLLQNGSFRVVDGAILSPDGETEPVQLDLHGAGGPNTATAPLQRAIAEVVYNQDVLINGSLCVGFDCGSSQSFGADTIRVRENNTRIHFDDTSNSASFPNNDWRLLANEQSNGGRNVFQIQDATAGREVISVEAGARSYALYVESDGDVGFGTMNPVVNLHAVDGNTPTLRLEQDGSSGFTPQSWDVAGNETNFFIRDVTNGSKLPFRIKPNSPGDSIFIDTDGVGINTSNPDTDLNVVQLNSTTGFHLERAGNPVTMLFEDTVADQKWEFKINSAGGFAVNDPAASGGEMTLTSAGDLTIKGDLTANGTNYPSSRSLKENFSAVDGREILARLDSVPVSVWTYKNDPARRHIGPVTEDFSQAFDFLEADGKLNTIDLHGVALAAIQGLNQEVAEKDARIADLEERLAALEARLDEAR
jgi:hypothetical protein